MLSQKIQILLLKSAVLMVLPLFLDVVRHGIHIGLAHGKCPVTFLPCEISQKREAFMDPLRGILSDIALSCLLTGQAVQEPAYEYDQRFRRPSMRSFCDGARFRQCMPTVVPQFRSR